MLFFIYFVFNPRQTLQSCKVPSTLVSLSKATIHVAEHQISPTDFMLSHFFRYSTGIYSPLRIKSDDMGDALFYFPGKKDI